MQERGIEPTQYPTTRFSVLRPSQVMQIVGPIHLSVIKFASILHDQDFVSGWFGRHALQ
jgi:hypothetical protein